MVYTGLPKFTSVCPPMYSLPIFSCCKGHDGRDFTYKLIGFGTAQDSDDTAAKEAVKSSAETLSIGAGMPPYMSPELYKDPSSATYPADIWHNDV
jgi:serine/threonine protein kinase